MKEPQEHDTRLRTDDPFEENGFWSKGNERGSWVSWAYLGIIIFVMLVISAFV